MSGPFSNVLSPIFQTGSIVLSKSLLPLLKKKPQFPSLVLGKNPVFRPGMGKTEDREPQWGNFRENVSFFSTEVRMVPTNVAQSLFT